MVYIYKRIAELKQPFSRALEAIGEVDAYCSLATLYREHSSSGNGFCFPELKQSQKPFIDLQDAWDPLTGAKESVPNSMSLGCNSVRNAILSGPNAGGKSTFMRAMLFASVMAQTCGLVPAKKASLTPFSYIDSYVNIEDDPVAKKSLFRMQAYRVSSLIKNIESLDSGKHALVIADEMFSGTNPTDAACIGCAVANKISKLPNSIWLISTHYLAIRRVAQDSGGIFANFKVGVHRDKKGRFIGYPFTVTRGITEESTAIDVLEAEKFHPEVLRDAKRIRVNQKFLQ